MGADTECDLAIEAPSPAERAAVANLRNRLIAEHCGTSTEAVASALARCGSLLALVDASSSRGRRLCPIDDGPPEESEFAAYLEEIADPDRPLRAQTVLQRLAARLPGVDRRVAVFAAIGLLIVGLALAWSYTPLAELTDPDAIRGWFATIAQQPWSFAIVIAIFVAAGLVAFPVVLLIAGTAAVFGPWFGFLYATSGALASAFVGYLIGAWLGRESLKSIIGPKLDRVRARIAKQGIFAVAAVRLVPVAPFTLINLAAGASDIKPFDYMAGTLLGLLPGLVVMSALGHQVLRMMQDPSAFEMIVLVLAIAAWIGVSFAIQAAVTRLGSSTR
jgi:uncharacterized membrane protein YdjX (TVP38/TMEM64 family)